MERTLYRGTSQLALQAEMHERDLLNEARQSERAASLPKDRGAWQSLSLGALILAVASWLRGRDRADRARGASV